MKTAILTVFVLAASLTMTACTTSSPSIKDYQMMQAVYKSESAKDQQTIAGLRAELDRVQRDLQTVQNSRAALEAKVADAVRRFEQQRDELNRAKDERPQLAQTGRQLAEELARARDERAQFTQTARQLTQQVAELERLRQSLADVARDQTRMQTLEATLEKQSKELTELKTKRTAAAAPAKKSPKAAAVPGAAPAISDGGPAPGAAGANPAPATSGATAAALSPRTIIVKPGDTLTALARKHGVAVAQLKDLNQLEGDRILIGQPLVIPDSVN
jgi:LysM repeat protein